MSFDPNLNIKPASQGKAPASFHAFDKHFQGRKIHSLDENLTPSVGGTKNIPQGVREHGCRRVEVFDYFIHKIQGIAVRSDGSVLDVKGVVKGARLQHGKGSRKKRTNSAHVNPIAGLVDNFKELSINQMVKESDISPKKKQYLTSIGATAEQIHDIYLHLHDKQYVIDKVVEIAPGPSAFSGTTVDKINNTCSELPFEANLVDSALEREIRPQVTALAIKAMKGEVTNRQAREEFVDLVLEGLKNVGRVLKAQLKFEYELDKNFSKTQKKLSYVRLEMDGTRKALEILNSREDQELKD